MKSFRFPCGLPPDPRITVLARRAAATRTQVLAFWVLLFDHAARQETAAGSVRGLDIEEAAAMLEMEPRQAEALLRAFCDKGIVSESGVIAEWGKIQAMRPSTRRVQRHRRGAKETLPAADDENEVARRRARLSQQMKLRHRRHGKTMSDKGTRHE